jgi:hypothetical protein
MIGVALISLAVNFASQRAANPASADRPFNLKRYVAPEAVYEDNRNLRPHCVDIGRGMRVCKRLEDSATWDIVFTIEHGGTVLGKWPSSTYNGGTSFFDVLRGDIDANGDEEVIVANLSGISCGMGIQYWTVSILPDPIKHGFKQPLQFSSEELGAEGAFVKHPGDKRCHILVTNWEYMEDAKRGGGEYLVGRWFRYRDGLLQPVRERPVLSRRFLFSFQNERSNTSDDKRMPLSWLKNRNTESHAIDPLLRWKESSSVEGVVLAFVLEPSKTDTWTEERKIKVKLASGEVVDFTVSDVESETVINHLGDAASKAIYPEDYHPADSKIWITGRRIRITAYKDKPKWSDKVYTRRIAWIGNASANAWTRTAR